MEIHLSEFENMAGKGEPVPDMPILGSSNLAAYRDIMSKIWTNGDSFI